MSEHHGKHSPTALSNQEKGRANFPKTGTLFPKLRASFGNARAAFPKVKADFPNSRAFFPKVKPFFPKARAVFSKIKAFLANNRASLAKVKANLPDERALSAHNSPAFHSQTYCNALSRQRRTLITSRRSPSKITCFTGFLPLSLLRFR